jgi:hypothetical protein
MTLSVLKWLNPACQMWLPESTFATELFRESSMAFAVEAQKLLGVSLEGSVG